MSEPIYLGAIFYSSASSCLLVMNSNIFSCEDFNTWVFFLFSFWPELAWIHGDRNGRHRKVGTLGPSLEMGIETFGRSLHIQPSCISNVSCIRALLSLPGLKLDSLGVFRTNNSPDDMRIKPSSEEWVGRALSDM